MVPVRRSTRGSSDTPGQREVRAHMSSGKVGCGFGTVATTEHDGRRRSDIDVARHRDRVVRDTLSVRATSRIRLRQAASVSRNRGRRNRWSTPFIPCTCSARIEVTPSWLCSTPSTIRNGSSTIDQPIAREQIGADDDVGDAGLVLEREEHEPFRGAGALARDDHAGDADAAALPRAPADRWRAGCRASPARRGAAPSDGGRRSAPSRHSRRRGARPRSSASADTRPRLTIGRNRGDRRVAENDLFQKRSPRSRRALRFSSSNSAPLGRTARSACHRRSGGRSRTR